MKDQRQQYILARDMIDMIRDYRTDADALEYLDSFAFSLAMIAGEDSAVDWHKISSVCDQAWYGMKQGEAVDVDMKTLDTLYQMYEQKIGVNEDKSI